jgi:hypothetical protein
MCGLSSRASLQVRSPEFKAQFHQKKKKKKENWKNNSHIGRILKIQQ